MELTTAYGVLLNQGSRAEPYAILAVKDNSGKVLEQSEPQTQEVISKETAYLITNMMEDVIQKGTGQAAKVIGRPIAGKTGPQMSLSTPGLSAVRRTSSPASTLGLTIGVHWARRNREPMPRCPSGSIL